jgi:hypothetical protein
LLALLYFMVVQLVGSRHGNRAVLITEATITRSGPLIRRLGQHVADDIGV